MKTKRFKTCIGCPFTHWGRCGLVPQRKGEWRSPEIPRASLMGRSGPPTWCPLRKGPLTLELAADTKEAPSDG